MENLSTAFPVWLCDVWGVVHDGFTPYPEAVAALARHRARGGLVILISNSPRTSVALARQLDEIGVARQAYDAIVTSGDVTRALIAGHSGGKVFHVGAEHDLSVIEGLAVERVQASEAHAVLCTGLADDFNETPEDYLPALRDLRALELPMICANPDKIVRKGSRLVYCAGALAEAYTGLGGAVLMAGKPHRPIYDVALAEAGRLCGRTISPTEILAIGDGPETDMRGAADNGFAALLIVDGVHDANEDPDTVKARVRELVPKANIVAALGRLSWAW